MTLLLWVIFSAMVAVAAAGLAIPLVRRYDGQASEADAVTAVLRDQLAEVDAQAAAGSVPATEAEALKTEIKRRLLVEHRALPLPARLLGDRAAGRFALTFGAVVALAATAIYAVRGRPELAGAAAPVQTAAAAPAADPAAAALLGQLEARMAKAPDDAEGWGLLGGSYFQMQRFADSAAAYAKAAALQPKAGGFASAQGEALVNAANGVVTPAAAAAFIRARAADPADPRARYFLAVRRDQGGDHKGAIDDLVTLVNEAPPGAPWAQDLRQFVEQTAREAGIDVSGRLKPAAGAPPIIAGAANARGPTAADVATIQALPQGEQKAFITAMVDGLAEKLKANPRDADGWVRLIRARTVLGDTAGAKAALASAQAAFADQPATRKSLADQAAALGVAG